MTDLFEKQESFAPLAEQLRPQKLEDIIGQAHLLGTGKPLSIAFKSGKPHSMILWGPPGTGKTTLARLMARAFDAKFIALSAVLSGVKDIRDAIELAQVTLQQSSQRTILFVDEVHRFNKSQQDAFLPFVENGTLTFIGATTENPSFELNNALLSRARVYVLKTLDVESLSGIVKRAMADKELGLGDRSVAIDDDALELILLAADGDARRALNLIELAADIAPDDAKGITIDRAIAEEVVQGSRRRFDKKGEYFYCIWGNKWL